MYSLAGEGYFWPEKPPLNSARICETTLGETGTVTRLVHILLQKAPTIFSEKMSCKKINMVTLGH